MAGDNKSQEHDVKMNLKELWHFCLKLKLNSTKFIAGHFSCYLSS